MATKKIDSYANIAAILALETVAGTAAYAKFAFPFSIMDKMALVIQRVEYWFGDLSPLNSSTDFVLVGLAASNTVSDLNLQNDPLVIDSAKMVRNDMGTAAASILTKLPYIKDFTDLAGGGILVAPNPLYGFCKSNGAAGVMGAWIKMFYTYLALDTDEYWQLVESRRIISS
jgi:hypothetical protein